MNDEKGLSPLGEEIVDALTEFHDTLKEGGIEAVERKFTVKTMKLKLEPRFYSAEDVKRVRRMLRLSQPLFAQFLGVSANAVRSWENGGKTPSRIACRFLDVIERSPALFRDQLLEAISPR